MVSAISSFRQTSLRNLAFHLDLKGEKRSFKSSWFDTWPWLHYLEGKDSVLLCFYCSQATEKKFCQKITPKQILHLSLLDSLTGKMHVQDSGLQLILAKYVCHNCFEITGSISCPGTMWMPFQLLLAHRKA